MSPTFAFLILDAPKARFALREPWNESVTSKCKEQS
jgi:hypothetical protein